MKKLIAAVFIILTYLPANSLVKDDSGKKSFIIKKGVNVSHWLSQTEIRGEERAAYVTEKDFIKIAELGFDHVRIPIDEEQFWDEDGKKEEDAFELLHNAIKWSMANNLKVIVDLHILRSHHFNIADNRQLWDDPSLQEEFIGFWKQLSDELEDYPLDFIAYELLNEAVSDNPDDWNNLLKKAYAEVRKLEPDRVIVIGSNRYQIVETFEDLKVPAGDPNIILSFHYYNPMLLTHYKAPWTGVYGYEGEVSYPGYTIDKKTWDALDNSYRQKNSAYYKYYDKEVMEKDILKAVKVARANSLPLYCGEFGCFPSTPVELRAKLYKDLIEIFNKHNIAWSHWNYKNDFPLVTEDLEPISELVNALLE